MLNRKDAMYTTKKVLVKTVFVFAAVSSGFMLNGRTDIDATTVSATKYRNAQVVKLQSNLKGSVSNTDSNLSFFPIYSSKKSVLSHLKEVQNDNNQSEELEEETPEGTIEEVTEEVTEESTKARGVIIIPDVTEPDKPVIKSVASNKAKTATVTYQKSSGATGYEISYATSKSGTYKVAGTTTSTSYTISSLTSNKTYYVRVRAYKLVNGQRVYGSYSTVKSVTVS